MENVINMKKKILVAIILFIAVLMLAECQKLSRTFYVDILNVYLHIEEIKDGMYRIDISKAEGKQGEDYIEVVYKFSEMPSITLSFPLDDSNDIHIIDRQHIEVIYCNSNSFNIIYPDIANENYVELGKYQTWCDSVMFEIPSVSVQIDPYLKSLSIWNENSKFIGTIYPEN